MANYLQDLAGGLRSAAGILNPAIQRQTFEEDDREKQVMEGRRKVAAQQIIKAAEMGAIEPEVARAQLRKLGFGDIATGPSADIVEKQRKARRDQEFRTRYAAAQTPEERRSIAMEFASPDQLIKMKTEGGFTLGPEQTRFDAEGNEVATGKGKADKAKYKERNVSYDGRTYTREISRDEGVTWEAIPGSKPVDIRKATGGADIRVSVDPGNPLAAADRTDRRQVVQQTRATDALIQDLTVFLRDLAKTPGGVGIRGAVGQPVAGVVGQINEAAGRAASKAITGASPEAVAQLRVRSQLLRGKLLPVVTNETGRYTEAERAIATEAQGALDAAQGVAQVRAGTKALIMLSVADRERGLKNLGAKPKHDLSTERGFFAQAKELKALGLNDEEAVKATKLMQTIRAQQ